MTNYVAIMDGGKTSQEGAMRLWRKTSSNGQGPVGTDDYKVTQTGSPSTSVLISNNGSTPGDLLIAYQGYAFHGWSDATVTTSAVTSNSSGSTRIDSVVAYIDLASVSSASNNNPGSLKFMIVVGTTSAPTGGAIQSAVGGSNPYYVLANISVANGFPTSPTTITNANITDRRTRYLLGNSGSLPPFSVAGSLAITNDLCPRWIVPPGVSAINRLDATCITAPTGSGLTLRLYNVTQAATVGTVTIAAGSTTANNTSMTTPTLATGDVIRFDCTAVGSTVAGADVTVQPSA